MKAWKLIPIGLALAAFAAAAWWSWGPRHTPAGQPPMATITPATTADFVSQFNASLQSTRLLLLLSPT
ncbi:MAG TPA: hypothetical protein VNF74_15065 [Terriglobales bacterium]|nr:hypothetical protein [Terriglobales bacterium]